MPKFRHPKKKKVGRTQKTWLKLSELRRRRSCCCCCLVSSSFVCFAVSFTFPESVVLFWLKSNTKRKRHKKTSFCSQNSFLAMSLSLSLSFFPNFATTPIIGPEFGPYFGPEFGLLLTYTRSNPFQLPREPQRRRETTRTRTILRHSCWDKEFFLKEIHICCWVLWGTNMWGAS